MAGERSDGPEDESGQHEKIVNSLLDLQARLRGEPATEGQAKVTATKVAGSTPAPVAIPEAAPEPPAEVRAEAGAPEIAVTEGEVQVLVTPDPADAEERDGFAPVTTLPTAGAADDRVAALAERLGQLEDELSGFLTEMDRAGEDRIAERVVKLEQRMLHEIGSQRADIIQALGEGFERLESTVKDAWREALRDRPEGGTQPDQPA